jgi:hypothetical protein
VRSYGAPLPRYVEDELREYLRCGVFSRGSVRARRASCEHELLVAFSCKLRGVWCYGMSMMRASAIFLFVALAGCARKTSSEPCHAGNTGVAGAKTGVTTAVEGVKTFGDSAVGLVEGGSSEAKKRWKAGSRETKSTAREGGAETKAASHDKQCH